MLTGAVHGLDVLVERFGVVEQMERHHPGLPLGRRRSGLHSPEAPTEYVNVVVVGGPQRPDLVVNGTQLQGEGINNLPLARVPASEESDDRKPDDQRQQEGLHHAALVAGRATVVMPPVDDTTRRANRAPTAQIGRKSDAPTRALYGTTLRLASSAEPLQTRGDVRLPSHYATRWRGASW